MYLYLPVLGHKAFTAILYFLNSAAIPKTHIDIPYLDIVYATWSVNQLGFIFNGGLIFKMCACLLFFK